MFTRKVSEDVLISVDKNIYKGNLAALVGDLVMHLNSFNSGNYGSNRRFRKEFGYDVKTYIAVRRKHFLGIPFDQPIAEFSLGVSNPNNDTYFEYIIYQNCEKLNLSNEIERLRRIYDFV